MCCKSYDSISTKSAAVFKNWWSESTDLQKRFFFLNLVVPCFFVVAHEEAAARTLGSSKKALCSKSPRCVSGEEQTIIMTFQTFLSTSLPLSSLSLFLHCCPLFQTSLSLVGNDVRLVDFQAMTEHFAHSPLSPEPGTGRGGAHSLLISRATGSAFLSHWQAESSKKSSRQQAIL